MLLVTLISVIGSLLAFDQFYIMTNGQPLNQTATSVFYVYLNSFPYLKLGYGAALSLILAAIILCLHHLPDGAEPPEPRVSAWRTPNMAASADRRRRAPRSGFWERRNGYLVAALLIFLCGNHAPPLLRGCSSIR